jgi:hypothetical protein
LVARADNLSEGRHRELGRAHEDEAERHAANDLVARLLRQTAARGKIASASI